jgi:ABC-type uncharacterized transport system ATPase subunit
MTALKVSGLHKKFGDIVALDGLDLEVQSGEIFSLLGPSASNKTTTLRTICGIESLAASSWSWLALPSSWCWPWFLQSPMAFTLQASG